MGCGVRARCGVGLGRLIRTLVSRPALPAACPRHYLREMGTDASGIEAFALESVGLLRKYTYLADLVTSAVVTQWKPSVRLVGSSGISLAGVALLLFTAPTVVGISRCATPVTGAPAGALYALSRHASTPIAAGLVQVSRSLFRVEAWWSAVPRACRLRGSQLVNTPSPQPPPLCVSAARRWLYVLTSRFMVVNTLIRMEPRPKAS